MLELVLLALVLIEPGQWMHELFLYGVLESYVLGLLMAAIGESEGTKVEHVLWDEFEVYIDSEKRMYFKFDLVVFSLINLMTVLDLMNKTLL